MSISIGKFARSGQLDRSIKLASVDEIETRNNLAPWTSTQDNLAGVRLFESKQPPEMAIKFGDGSPDAKPSQAVINRIKEAGYRWNPGNRVWTHPVRPDSALSTRIEAEQLYQEVRQMIRQEKGIEPGQEVPF